MHPVHPAQAGQYGAKAALAAERYNALGAGAHLLQGNLSLRAVISDEHEGRRAALVFLLPLSSGGGTQS